MKRLLLWVIACCISSIAVAGETASTSGMTAEQIIEKNIAARGGLDAWRKIETMAWLGRIESPNGPGPSIPFILEMKRPNKTRFEIKVQNQIEARIFDGAHGWKIWPGKNGMPELQPYTTAELKFAQDWEGIDGPLMDYNAKGISVSLEGIDKVEGNKAYRLNVRMPSGAQHHLWIDAKTFLDVKYDRESSNAFGLTGTISVFYRNYHKVKGLQIPLEIETGSAISKKTDKMIIERIALNPAFKGSTFAKPNIPQRKDAYVDTVPRLVNRPASTMPSQFFKTSHPNMPVPGSAR